MTTSTLVYSTDNPPVFVEEDDICLGSQGVISTAQCVRIALLITGTECPVCVL